MESTVNSHAVVHMENATQLLARVCVSLVGRDLSVIHSVLQEHLVLIARRSVFVQATSLLTSAIISWEIVSANQGFMV
jgi:hypothetical protein